MKTIKRLLKISIFSFLLVGTALAQSTDQGIRDMLSQRDVQIKELLGEEGQEYSDEQRTDLKEIINGVISFEAMAKTALAETYDTITAEQRTEFVTLFSTIIRDHSLNKLEIYRAKVTYNSVEIDGSNATVKTMAELDDIRTPVDYKMQLNADEWVITDMSVDDLWTAESYNKQFQRIIARRGFDALMDSLRKRAAK